MEGLGRKLRVGILTGLIVMSAAAFGLGIYQFNKLPREVVVVKKSSVAVTSSESIGKVDQQKSKIVI